MSANTSLQFEYALRSDVGRVRQVNEDSGLACGLLLTVADGLGGHACGEVASRIAVQRSATMIDPAHSADNLSARMHSVINDIAADIDAHVHGDPEAYGMGTTLTNVAIADGALVIGHIGDSRAYLLRDGMLERLTIDHTYVQQLVDAGQLRPEEVATHPRRSVLLRAIGAEKGSQPDVSIRDARVGDRLLLCSDGLSGEVDEDAITRVLADVRNVSAAVAALIELALDAGAKDNVTCVVADVIEAAGSIDADPIFAGAAAAPITAGASTHADAPSPAAVDGDKKVAAASAKTWRRFLRRYRTALVFFAGMLTALLATVLLVWSQWWVGVRDAHVVIGRGMSQPVLGLQIGAVVQTSPLLVGNLPAFQREQVTESIHAGSLAHAQEILRSLECAVAGAGGNATCRPR